MYNDSSSKYKCRKDVINNRQRRIQDKRSSQVNEVVLHNKDITVINIHLLNIILSEVSQKDKYHMISLICGI